MYYIDFNSYFLVLHHEDNLHHVTTSKLHFLTKHFNFTHCTSSHAIRLLLLCNIEINTSHTGEFLHIDHAIRVKRTLTQTNRQVYCIIGKEVIPVKVMMIITANMSGYSARTPGTFMVRYCLQNVSMCLPIRPSNVALQARATLDVPA